MLMSFYRSGMFHRPSFFGGGFRFFPPVIKWLLITNAALWLLVDVFLAGFTVGGVRLGGGSGLLTRWFALWPVDSGFFWPWQFLTYMFMHGGLGHLFFNMFALWMFGMELEHKWGSRQFLLFYLVCGLGAGIANLIVTTLMGTAAPTVGASGAVFGVLIAFGMLFPDRPIYLYFLLPVKAKYFVAAYIGLELFYGVAGTATGVAHFAHLGGAVVGFVYTLIIMGLIPVAPLGDLFRRTPGGYRPPVGRNESSQSHTHDARFFDIKTGRRVDDEPEVTQQVVDEILDKIGSSGYQSLTEEEKRILNEASKKIH